jgi:hypothetical protein
VLLDALGKKVMESTLLKSEGVVTFNTSALTRGVYFYSLRINNQLVVTKQLVITN